VLDFVMHFKQVNVKEAGQWLIALLERSTDQRETPAVAGEESGSGMQSMCRAIARYLSAAFPMLGDTDKIAGELGVLLAEETGTVPVSKK